MLFRSPASSPTASLVVKTVDRNGGVLPGVTVKLSPAALTVVNGRSNVVESFATGMSGEARLDGITPGNYALTVGALPGFTTYTRPRSALAAGQTLAVTVMLDLDAFFEHPDVPSIATLPNPVADRKSTRLNSSHSQQSRMPSSA